MRQRARYAALLAVLLIGCRSTPDRMITVEVAQVGFDASAGAPVVVLETADARRLPIWIGPAEADAIARELQGVTPPRPMTHDLMAEILTQVESTLVRVRITVLREQTFYAVLELKRGGRAVEIDCRPSDGIALALRTGSPIVVHPALLDRVEPGAEQRAASLPRATRGTPPPVAQVAQRLTKFRAMA